MENGELKRKYSEAEIKEKAQTNKASKATGRFFYGSIAQSPMSLDEARQIVQAVRGQAIRLFPGKEETFELLYTPRFRRLIAEKFSLL